MRNIFSVFDTLGFDETKPWLVLGKGPSFSKLSDYPRQDFNLLSLNHCGRELPVDIAHVIDIEVIESCGPALLTNARYLLMPFQPHHKFRPGGKTLTDYLGENSILAEFEKTDRLLWYDLASASSAAGSFAPVPIRFFSSEAVLAILARLGVKVVRSLGIDGGGEYAGNFSDLVESDRLANGQPSFDQQFANFPALLKSSGLSFGPLDMTLPARVFVGGSEAEWLPFKVLEYSIGKHSSLDVKVSFLSDCPQARPEAMPMPRHSANRPRTLFSFQRFLIPSLCNFQGRALYLDSDMLVHKDLRSIFRHDIEELDLVHVAAATPRQKESQFAVMLLNCRRLNWTIESVVAGLDRGEFSYRQLMQEMNIAGRKQALLSHSWNHLDEYRKGVSALTHYTDAMRQPWLCRDNPAEAIWLATLVEAVQCGHLTLTEIEREVELGHVRPSLVSQVELLMAGQQISRNRCLQLDANFTAPICN